MRYGGDMTGQQPRPFQGMESATPWDALLLEVRRSAYRAGWIDQRIEELLQRERELQHEAEYFGEMSAVRKELREWLKESRNERRHLTNVAANAIRAGFAERTLHAAQVEARTIAHVLGRAIAPLGLDEEQEQVAARALREALEDVSTERFETAVGQLGR